MSAFTPGPWHAEQCCTTCGLFGIYAGEGKETPVLSERVAARANATLMAAAPELLAALEMSVAPVPQGETWEAFLVRREAAARAAIAKAEGR